MRDCDSMWSGTAATLLVSGASALCLSMRLRKEAAASRRVREAMALAFPTIRFGGRNQPSTSPGEVMSTHVQPVSLHTRRSSVPGSARQ